MRRHHLALGTLLIAMAMASAAWAITPILTGLWWQEAVKAITALTAVLLLPVLVWPRPQVTLLPNAPDTGTTDGANPRDRLLGGPGALTMLGLGTLTAAWWVLARFGPAMELEDALAAQLPPHFDPTPSIHTWRHLAELGATVPTILHDEVAPVLANVPVSLVLVGGVLVATLVANLFLLAGKPALVVLPIVALWLPTLAFGQTIPPVAFVGSAGALVALIALTSSLAARVGFTFAHPRRGGSRAWRWRIRSRQIATAGTAGLLVLALAGAGRIIGTPTDGGVRWFEPTGIDFGTGALAGDIDLTQDFGYRSTRELFRYTTSDGKEAGPFATRTMSNWDGRTWTPSRTTASDLFAPSMLHQFVPEVRNDAVSVNLVLAEPAMPVLPAPSQPWELLDEWGLAYNVAHNSLESHAPGGGIAAHPTLEFYMRRNPWTPSALRAAEEEQRALVARNAPSLDLGEIRRETAEQIAMHAQRDNANEAKAAELFDDIVHHSEGTVGVVGYPDEAAHDRAIHGPHAGSMISEQEAHQARTEFTLSDGTKVRFGGSGYSRWFYSDGSSTLAYDPYTGAVASLTFDVNPTTLAIPPTSRVRELRDLTLELTAGADTAYDQAVAIQNWLRDPENFTYELTAPPVETGDIVWDFIQARTGYCIHFATTMAMMARHLGIPARVVTGFLSGPADGDEFVVTAEQAHLWPELLLPGAGWVRFEPTPGSVAGPVPISDELELGDLPSEPTAQDELAQMYIPEPMTSSSIDAGQGAAAPVPLRVVARERAVATGSATVATALGAVATVVVARKRRTMDPEGAWAEAVTTLQHHGVPLNGAHTPRQAVLLTAQHWENEHQEPFPPDAGEGLGNLARAVEAHRYHLGGANPDKAELWQWLAPIREVRQPRRASSWDHHAAVVKTSADSLRIITR